MSERRWVGRVAAAAPAVVVGVFAAAAMINWEARTVSPADGDPQARQNLLIAATLWALMLAYDARMRSRRIPQPAVPERRWPPSKLLVAAATGVVVGAVLFLALMPLGRYEARWRIYMAAMRSDLNDLAAAQEGYLQQYGRPATSLDELDMLASEGVLIDVRSSASGWSASARHVALGSFGFPQAVCIVFGGDARVNNLHRFSDGRVPLQSDTPACELGRFDRVGSGSR